MALDLTGIENVEFYSAHYLDAVLEGDLKQVFERWKKAKDDDGRKPPYEALNALANPYFQTLARAEGERDEAERWRLARGFHADLIAALGYEYRPTVEALDGDTVIPVLAALRRDSRPYLWIVDAPFVAAEDDDPLEARPLPEQLPAEAREAKLPDASWRELFDETVFRLDRPPRWVLFLAGREVVLLERHKWPQGRLLRFDLGDLFSRRQAVALRAMAALLHRDVLAPDDGLCLHDTLDEKSHKHAFAVSDDLKHGVRRAVELLANEAIWYRREVQKQGVFNENEIAPRLTEDCLTWLYRLLFLFYVEARGAELDVVPMKSDAYRDGYSLETLRDLELVPLTTEQARNGTYIYASLTTLFRILNEGFGSAATGLLPTDSFHHDTFEVPALNSPLFDDSRLKILRGVKFRNHVLQEILQLLSLSAEKKNKTRGRISYAQLGISQLGAVYEGILSYTGFFAHEDLYEVASKDECEKLSGKPAAEREALKTYFVPKSRIGEYEKEEIVRDEHGRPVVHAKGSFLFRMAGRNREKSASYYTPEVLTRCVVKYALKELLWEEENPNVPPLKKGVGAERRGDLPVVEDASADHAPAEAFQDSHAEAGQIPPGPPFPKGGNPTPRRKKTAAEILQLTICEPAMGSGAFLAEAVDQLADAYLEARQEERGETIPADRYQYEKRRVKARLATNNCYGVDLNPTAVELAKVSLWLATMHEGGKCPWFGLRLATGNSLIGARREVFKTADVTRKGSKESPNWLNLVPEPVPLFEKLENEESDFPPLKKGGQGGFSEGPTKTGGSAEAPHREIPLDPPFSKGEVLGPDWFPPARPKGSIYHFLLPADGMAPFDKDKVVKELAPESVERIKAWRKKFCESFDKQDAQRLERLSDAVDRLFAEVVRERVFATGASSDRIPVWGEDGATDVTDAASKLLVRDQEALARALESESSAYRRLKLAMDAWCALWFWPIEQAELLPDRASWLASLELVLLGEVTKKERWEQRELFAELTKSKQETLPLAERVPEAVEAPADAGGDRLDALRALSEKFVELRRNAIESCGLANVEKILHVSPMLRTAAAIADRLRFHHWDLRFAEVFAQRGGFDLILGNPPWVLISFSEVGVLSEHAPSIQIRKATAATVAATREKYLESALVQTLYLREFEEQAGVQEFLSAATNEPLLVGMKTNSYKCFLTRAWKASNFFGVSSFLHPEGIYDDPKGGKLRAAAYSRLTAHYQFINEGHLFPEVHNLTKYSINLYSARRRTSLRFVHISNLFHPRTIDASWIHDGYGEIPGIKNRSNEFDQSGHLLRIVFVGHSEMATFGRLFDPPGTPPSMSRLPVVHSQEILNVLRRLAGQPRRLKDLSEHYFATYMFDETASQKKRLIERNTQFVPTPEQLILQGPHFYVATPFNKTPNADCSSNRDYTQVDLRHIPAGYLPRTNYLPSDRPRFADRIPVWKGKPSTTFYRHVNRQMASPTGERTLVGAIVPPGVTHVLSVLSICFDNPRTLLFYSGLTASLPYDFLAKSSGKNHVDAELSATFPLPDRSEGIVALVCERAVALNCVTDHFASLWEELGKNFPACDELLFAKADRRLAKIIVGSTCWASRNVLRGDFERRQALIELDVLSAIALDMRLTELVSILRVQFPILQQYERERLYDQHGRIVPTAKKILKHNGVDLVALAGALSDQAGFDPAAEYHPGAANTVELLRQRVKLSKRDAEILGVDERCTMADLMTETEVRWSDDEHPEGRPVRLVGLRYTDPGLEPRMERVYPTPWTRCDREADYRQAWAEFERRLGKNEEKPDETA